jgi:hypothetical protein
LSGYVRSSRKECADLVAGQAVLTFERRDHQNWERHDLDEFVEMG